ncbi:MAG: T9SS type A sorting domain-containing protein, partial [Bacteroidales bacterium]|nr:T9SS type A sorting domain-containing protein [Bacteroidales bacterium]
SISFGSSVQTYVSGYENLNVGNVTSYNVTSLTTGTTYFYVVRATNASGTSGNSNEISVATLASPATSTFTGTGDWTNAPNWNNGLPTGTTDVIINGNVTVDDVVECNNMTISSTGAVTVGAGQGLFVNGNLLIESNATGTGSFIGAAADYLIGGTTTIQRYLTGGWDGWDAGWHQLSSPVAAQPIADFATTGSGNDYDFYGWDEPTDTWMNYKAAGFSTWNSGTNFNEAQGYLVSYEAANTTQTFTGVLNTDDVTIENMSNDGNGWHLLGNPYASALVWNDDDNWILDNVAGNAKIWHETNKSYSDIAANGIIPSAQGFMVQVNNSSNSLLFLETARTHSATPFYKSGTEQLLLVAAETEGGSAQESKIMVNPMATEGFDFDYDSRFLAGYAPMLYSVVGDELLSTNSLPELASGKVIPLGFVKNSATNFTIELKESIPAHAVYLTDKKTDIVTNLTESPVYSFTSSEGDDPNRFELKFGAVGIDDNIATEQISIYSHGRLVYISSTKSANALISIYNITGQQVYANTMVIDGQKQIALNTPTGWYIVKVRTQQGVATQKVFIKSNQ